MSASPRYQRFCNGRHEYYSRNNRYENNIIAFIFMRDHVIACNKHEIPFIDCSIELNI